MSEISWSYKKISLEYFKDKYVEYYEYCSKYFVRVGYKHNAVDILETKDKAVADKFVKDLESIFAASILE